MSDRFCEISQTKFDGIGDKEKISSNPHDLTCINLHIQRKVFTIKSLIWEQRNIYEIPMLKLLTKIRSIIIEIFSI